MSIATLPVTRTDACLAGLAACHARIDSMLSTISDSSRPSGDLAVLLREVERLHRRVDALRVRVIAEADTSRQSTDSGAANTGQWVGKNTGRGGRQAAGDAEVAAAIGNPQPAPAQPASAHPSGARAAQSATSRALDAGDISTAHAKLIIRTLAELPDWVTDEQRRQCEDELIRLCRNRSADKVRPLARRILERIIDAPPVEAVDEHESAALEAEETSALDRAEFSLWDNNDGTMSGRFTVPEFAGSILKKLIDAMTAPRRAGRHLADDGSTLAEQDRRWDAHEWAHRRGLAFTQLLEHLPTDHLHDKSAATVLVTMRLSDLAEQTHRAARTDTFHKRSPGEARRAACNAGIVPAVLGGASIPVDLGRGTRLFTPAQKAALATMYAECAADGCDRPFAWTEMHHDKPWSRGGPTDLANAVPLCGTHHRQVHHSRFSTSITGPPGGPKTVRIVRRT